MSRSAGAASTTAHHSRLKYSPAASRIFQLPASSRSRALRALLETQSVSAAARLLNLTQSAASSAHSRLRYALGDVLLTREGNRMSLSPRAERLLPRIRFLMAEIELTLVDDSFDPAITERTYRIAATDDAIEIVVAPLIERLRTAAQGSLID